MSIQFLTPKGNPVYLRRPELVVAVCGYHTTHEGRPALATRIQIENGEPLFVRGDVDAIQAALDEWDREQALHSEYCHRCPALAAERSGPSAEQDTRD